MTPVRRALEMIDWQQWRRHFMGTNSPRHPNTDRFRGVPGRLPPAPSRSAGRDQRRHQRPLEGRNPGPCPGSSGVLRGPPGGTAGVLPCLYASRRRDSCCGWVWVSPPASGRRWMRGLHKAARGTLVNGRDERSPLRRRKTLSIWSALRLRIREKGERGIVFNTSFHQVSQLNGMRKG